MTDEVKDPTKRRFWRLKNLLLLLATGAAPFAGTAAWQWASEKTSAFLAYEDRLRVMEANAASSNAVWGAVRELAEKHAAAERQMFVIQKLFDREWGRGAGEAQTEYLGKIVELDEQLRLVRESQRQLGILIKEYKAKNPDSKVGDVPQILPQPIPKPRVDWSKFSQHTLEVPHAAPASASLDSELLKEQYERKFPKTVPNQFKK